jgi:hypothetical protein
MTDVAGDAELEPDESSVLQITVDRSPESGLYTAQVRLLHPMIIKGYLLAEVFKAIWDALAAQNALGRFASDILVDFKYKHLREDNDRLAAEASQFAIALDRMIDPDHPHGPVNSMDQVRDLARTAFVNVRRAGRERRTAWREGALAQTDASTDRDLLHALCGAVNAVLPLLPPAIARTADGPDALRVALGRLRTALADCDAGTS